MTSVPAKRKRKHTIAQWARIITASWNQSVKSILDTGHNIRLAKADADHGEFESMLERMLPFGQRAAQMLMVIAADKRLAKAKNASLLPPHWTTLFELTKLDDQEFNRRVKDGTINPEMDRADIAMVNKTTSRNERESELAAKQRDLPDRRYGVIYADPEWRFEPHSRVTGMDRSPDNHYPTSNTDAICARPVGTIAAGDSILFLWATVPMLPDALKVMTAWGFDYKSHCVWSKDKLGTGYWFRNSHELLLVGTRGNIPAPAMGTQWPSLTHIKAAKHSAKPERFAQMIEEYFPNLPKIELNARKARKGWDCWGNEAPTDASGEPLDHDSDGVIAG